MRLSPDHVFPRKQMGRPCRRSRVPPRRGPKDPHRHAEWMLKMSASLSGSLGLFGLSRVFG